MGDEPCCVDSPLLRGDGGESSVSRKGGMLGWMWKVRCGRGRIKGEGASGRQAGWMEMFDYGKVRYMRGSDLS